MNRALIRYYKSPRMLAALIGKSRFANQYQIAEAAGCAPAAITMWKNGTQLPSDQLATAIVSAISDNNVDILNALHADRRIRMIGKAVAKLKRQLRLSDGDEYFGLTLSDVVKILEDGDNVVEGEQSN